MRIRWVNHASFVVEGEDFKLLVDPWLLGNAFNNGWSLLAPTEMDDSYWAGITHIWFSHEHPDHFSPPSLASIKDKLNPKAVIFYQETKDKRVVGYCKAKGYDVIEAKDRQKYKIGRYAEIMVGQVPFYDSWLHIQSDGVSLLNLNDCVIKNSERLESIKKSCGPVDILFCQFGYANWEGNPEEDARQKKSAFEKLLRLKLAADVFAPKYLFPFASYVVFSHSENFYLNANNNTVAKAVEFIQEKCTGQPVVLKPNDVWSPGDSVPLAENIRFYEEKRRAWTQGKSTDKTFSADQLLEIIDKSNQRVLTRNSPVLVNLCSKLHFFNALDFYVDDLDIVLRFDYLKGGMVLNEAYAPDRHIKLSSDSLAFLFSNEYGFDTLSVNGRFRATNQVEKQMFRTLSLGALNNMGVPLSFTLPFRWKIVSRVIAKLA